MSKFGWCYIGCGGIANTTAREIRKSENNRIAAVWNRGSDKASALYVWGFSFLCLVFAIFIGLVPF